MRTIGSKVRNKAVIKDPIGGGEVSLFYRTPTTDERQQYHASLFHARRGKVETTISAARQKYGKQILVGVGEKDFSFEEEDGHIVPLSSEPGTPGYRDDWKQSVCLYAADLVEALAFHVFEGATVVPEEKPEEPEPTEAGAEPVKN